MLVPLPDVLPVITMSDAWVLYPSAAEQLTCTFAEEHGVASFVAEVGSCDSLAVLVGAKANAPIPARAGDIFLMGTVARLSEMECKPDGTLSCLVYGLERVAIEQVVQETPYLRVRASRKPVTVETDSETAMLGDEVFALTERLFAIINQKPDGLVWLARYLGETQKVCYLIAYLLQMTARSDWSNFCLPVVLQMDESLRVNLLTCDSVKEKLLLLKAFLEVELPKFVQAQETAISQAAPQATGVTQHPASSSLPLKNAGGIGHEIERMRSLPRLPQPAQSAPPAVQHQASPPALKNTGGVVLGKAFDSATQKPTNNQVMLTGLPHRCAGLYATGGTGTGKTTLLTGVFLQDAAAGHGACYMTISPQAIEDIIARLPAARLKDAVLLNPGNPAFSFGLNLVPSPDQLLHVFARLWDIGPATPQLENILRNCVLALGYTQGATLSDIPLFLRNRLFRDDILTRLPAANDATWLRWFWQENFDHLPLREQLLQPESTLNKVLQFLTDTTIENIVGQAQTTLDVARIMRERKILLVQLPTHGLDSIGEHGARLIGTMLMAELLAAGLARETLPPRDRPFFSCFFDEFHLYATDEFDVLLTQIRRNNIAVHLAHQARSQLDSARLIGATEQMAHKVYFRIGISDARIYAAEVAEAPPDEKPVLTTTPYNVLPYLKQHEHVFVRRMWAQYIAPLDEALEKEGIRYDKDVYMNFLGDRVRLDYTIYPEWDFGSGKQEYEPDIVRKMRIAWNDLLAETIEQELPAAKMRFLWLKVVIGMAYFLDYQRYARFLYNNQPSLYTASVPRGDIPEYERLKELFASFLGSDEDLMRFFVAQTGPYHNVGSAERRRNELHNPFYYLHTNYEKQKQAFFKPDHYGKLDRESFPALLRKEKERPLEETKQLFLEAVAEFQRLTPRYRSVHTYLAFLIAGYKEIYSQIASTWLFNRNAPGFNPYTNRKDFNSLYQGDYKGSPCMVGWETWYFKRYPIIEKVRQKKLRDLSLSIDDALVAEQRPFHLYCTFTEAKDGLASEEGFVHLLAKHIERYELDDLCGQVYSARVRRNRDTTDLIWSHKYKTPERIRQLLIEDCEDKYAFLASRNTPEKLLATTRAALEAEIARIEEKLRPLYEEYNRALIARQQTMDSRKTGDQACHDRFVSDLNQLLAILKQPQYAIKVVAANYDHQPRRHITEGEMVDKMVRELANLRNFRARVKLMGDAPQPSVVIETVPLPAGITVNALVQRIADIQRQNIRDKYLRKRSDVEQEIRSRRSRWLRPVASATSGAQTSKECPACREQNRLEATVCEFCSAPLEPPQAQGVTRRRG